MKLAGKRMTELLDTPAYLGAWSTRLLSFIGCHVVSTTPHSSFVCLSRLEPAALLFKQLPMGFRMIGPH